MPNFYSSNVVEKFYLIKEMTLCSVFLFVSKDSVWCLFH